MSKALRYRNPKLQQHLSQQYALGLLSSKVARRLEKIMQEDLKLQEQVSQWQAKLTVIVDTVPDVEPPARVWRTLDKQINATPTAKHFLSHWLWPSALALSIMLLSVVSVKLWQVEQNQPQSTQAFASYVAVLNKVKESNFNEKLMISAYQGLSAGKSKLSVQWQQGSAEPALLGLELWSIRRDDGSAEKIDSLDNLINKQQFLTKNAWLKIKGSAFLEVRSSTLVLYRGACLQLEPWVNAEKS